MSTFIHHELFLLLRTIAVGAVLLLCYDLLAAFRNVFAHSDKAVGTEDILYWLCCAFFVFSEIYRSLHLLTGNSNHFIKNLIIITGISISFVQHFTKISPRTLLLFPVKRCKLLWYKAYKYAKKGRLANWVILRKGRKKRK